MSVQASAAIAGAIAPAMAVRSADRNPLHDPPLLEDLLGGREVVAHVPLSPDPVEVAADPGRDVGRRVVANRAGAPDVGGQVADLARPELAPRDRLDRDAETVGDHARDVADRRRDP